MNDLYTRMGNTVLNEVKTYDKEKSLSSSGHIKSNGFKEHRDLNNAFFRINRAMKNETQNYKNLNEFQKLQREKEMER